MGGDIQPSQKWFRPIRPPRMDRDQSENRAWVISLSADAIRRQPAPEE